MSDAIPLFVDLLRRHDLTRTDVVVYGALAAYEQRGEQPFMDDVARLVGMSVRRLNMRYQRLQERGLIQRYGRTARGKPQRYRLLGPQLKGSPRT